MTALHVSVIFKRQEYFWDDKIMTNISILGQKLRVNPLDLLVKRCSGNKLDYSLVQK